MANLKQAKKAVRKNVKKTAVNNEYKASMRTAIKKLEKAIAAKDLEQAKEALQVAIKRIDKAAKAGVITANYVSRTKSRLTLKVNNLK